MKNKNILFITLFIFFVLLISPIDLFPQQLNVGNSNQDFSELMALKLKQKLLLSDEQTAKVKVIISNYIDEKQNNNSSVQTNAGNQIETLLNQKQKDKFKIIENDFFEEINKRTPK